MQRRTRILAPIETAAPAHGQRAKAVAAKSAQDSAKMRTVEQDVTRCCAVLLDSWSSASTARANSGMGGRDPTTTTPVLFLPTADSRYSSWHLRPSAAAPACASHPDRLTCSRKP